MMYGDGEPLEAENSRQFFDIVAPVFVDTPASDRVALAALRLCDSINHLRMCEAVQQKGFRAIQSADPSSSLFALFPELAGPQALTEVETQSQLTEQEGLADFSEFDVEEARLAVSAMVEHVSGVFNLTDRQVKRALRIAKRREARVRLVADDKLILGSITLKTEPPTPFRDQPGK